MKSLILFYILPLIVIFPISVSYSESVGTITIDKNVISVPEDSFEILQISGTVDDYQKGQFINFQVLKPDGSTHDFKAVANEDGIYNSQLIIDANWVEGSYTITAKYREMYDVGSVSFSISSISGPDLPTFDKIGTIEIEDDEFTISSESKIIVDVTGIVTDSEKGDPVSFEITKPDGTNDVISVRIDYGGEYVLHLTIDDSPEWPVGSYMITGIYNENEIGTVNFELGKMEIPQWIKNNASWWSAGQIGDSDFISGIQFMIKNGIINIPNLPEKSSQGEENVPEWIRNNAGWWADGMISDDDFVSGIKYLVEKGIILV